MCTTELGSGFSIGRYLEMDLDRDLEASQNVSFAIVVFLLWILF